MSLHIFWLNISLLDPPKNVSASISPAGEILEGTEVTLTCTSSDANPPVQSYSWHRKEGNSTVGSEQIYSVSKATPKHSGHYYCVAKNLAGHSQSNVVHLDVHCE